MNSMNDENENEIIKKQVLAYFENKIAIHIKYKDGAWHNGYITSLNNDDFFMLNEREDGLLPVFYMHIKEVSKFIEEDGD